VEVVDVLSALAAADDVSFVQQATHGRLVRVRLVVADAVDEAGVGDLSILAKHELHASDHALAGVVVLESSGEFHDVGETCLLEEERLEIGETVLAREGWADIKAKDNHNVPFWMYFTDVSFLFCVFQRTGNNKL
jgi:hypothetical protein